MTASWYHVSTLSFAVLLATAVHAADSAVQTFRISLKVDLKRDTGQTLGTLFEVVDADGKPVAGAGFQNAYNTQDRSDRTQLQFYVIPSGEQTFAPEALPRPTTDAGTYLFGFENRVYSFSRAGGPDQHLKVWNDSAREWQRDNTTSPLSVSLGGKTLAFDQHRIRFGGTSILELLPYEGLIAEPYTTDDCLLFRRRQPETTPPGNELIAAPWQAGVSDQVDLLAGARQPLDTPGEFVYAWGQLGRKVLAATNTGGVHVFDVETRKWSTFRKPDGMSHQIYSTINYENSLLLGHYPSGELFDFDGEKLTRLRDQPPAMPGVSRSAREAQTLAIYGGELYAGVWPWGEVWRKDRRANTWRFMGRMFTHPAPTDKTTHPYENETKALDDVLNRWGQRVTSLVPFGDSLLISTSAKGPNPYEAKFTFLDGDKWKEYGSVYRYRKEGALSVPFRWKSSGTRFEFQFDGKHLVVSQDGTRIGTAECQSPLSARAARLVEREGVFGALSPSIELNDIDFDLQVRP